MHDDDVVLERDGAEEDGMSEVELEDQESRADTKLAKLRKELETAKSERQENLDGWQRAKADYVNALKRFEEERAEAKQQGVVKAARAFIAVMDSLARAESAGDIPDSFQAIAKQLHDAANSLGLVPFGSVGESFDPMLHEALGQDAVESADQDETVTAVLETGWKAGDLVVRAAKVRVGTYG
ncbi:MAG TPA: nucleotide exchange factor GrpE [Candidatus Paceibacterota bacterium]|nr:nucleotide exchange factor GrpE [Candidatus Paceibacterota bacterium]